MTNAGPRTNPQPEAVEVDWARLGVDHPRPFTLTLTIDRTHLGDLVPHVSNLEYVRWLEVAGDAHATALGYTRDWYNANDLIWFVRRHEVDYHAELLEGDRVVLATWIDGWSKSRCNRRVLMFRPADDAIVCRALTIWILVRLSDHRPVRVPEAMAARFLG